MRRLDIIAILIFLLFAGLIYGADSRGTPVTAVYCDQSTLEIYPFSLVTRADGSTFNCYEVLASAIENGYQYGFEDKDDADYDDLIVQLWITGNHTAAPVAHVKFLSKEASYTHWLYVVYNGAQQLVFKAESASPGTVFDIPLPKRECADFTLSATPGTQEVTQGGIADYTITLTAQQGFSETVDLSVQGLPNEKLAEFQPAALTPGGQSQLMIATREKTTAGTYPLTITGTSATGKITRSVQVTLEIRKSPPDFLLEADPVSRTLYPGQSANFNINVTAISDFAKEVKLSIDGLPGGVTAAFQPVSLVPGGVSLLNLSTAENATVGTYPLTVTGTSGSKVRQIEITLKLEERSLEPDFDLKAEPSSRTLLRGESTDYSVTVTARNEFTQPVALTVTGQPDGTTARFSSGTVTPTGTSQLQITTSGNTPVGDHILTLTGKGGEKEHSVTVKLSVSCPDFSLKLKAEPEKGAAPLTVKFSADVSPHRGYSLEEYHYSWNFGDGTTSTLQEPEHTFSTPGQYAATLTVTDPCGRGKTAAKTIVVEGFEGVISKSFAVSSALPGQEVVFTLETRNHSRFDFQDLRIRDELSPWLEYLEDSAPVTPQRSGQELLWQFPALAKGETLRFQVKVKVAENAPQGIITNVAYLFHDSLGPGQRLTSNTASLTIDKLDVLMLKQVEQTTAKPGDSVKYQLTVKNHSTIPLTGIKITDALSPYLEYLSQTQDGNLVFNRQARELEWSGTIEAGQQVKIVFKARVSPGILSGTRILNQARLRALELKEPVESNTVETLAAAEPITTSTVRFTKRSEVPQTEIGRIIRFNITVANLSNSTLLAPIIEDYLPQGFSYVASSSLLNQLAFSDPQGKRRLLWQFPHINPHETLVLRYQVVIGADTRRGRNINRATLRTTDNSGQEIFLEDSAFVNVSSSGIIFYSGVEGTVYLDRDDDDFFSMSDTPLENIEVRLSTGEEAHTDALGHYSFASLFPGEYAVGVNRATLPEKYRLDSPFPRVVVLADGFVDTADFAVKFQGDDTVGTARLQGRVFYDKNRNLVFDADDPLLLQFRARLDNALVTSGDNGTFVFTHLKPGPHILVITYDTKTLSKEITLVNGRNQIDIPLKFTGIKIIVKGEEQ